MNDVMGVLNLSENNRDIQELTIVRPISAIPFGGRYRIIDFALSNFVNADISNVSIFTNDKYRSLQDHISNGKHWDLDRKNDGLFMFNPIMDEYGPVHYRGDIHNFKMTMDYFKRSKQNYVILSSSYMLCNVDLREFYEFHKESNVDITIMYKSVNKDLDRFINCDVLNIDSNNNILSFGKNKCTKDKLDISMEIYILKKDLLISILEEMIATGRNEYLREGLHERVKNYKFNAYKFEGYLSCINNIENYYKSSMDLLDVNIARELFFKNGPIYTKIKDEPPVKYGKNSKAKNSLIANGCVIEGEIENSIVSRRVKIGKNCTIKNSILMQKCEIEDDVYLENVILDKNVLVTKGKELIGGVKNPLVIKKNKTI